MVSVVVHFQAHTVLDFVVLEGQVVLIDYRGFLQADLLWAGSDLRSRQFLQVEDGVLRGAFDSLLSTHAIVHGYFDQHGRVRIVGEFPCSDHFHDVDFLHDRKVRGTFL